MTLPDHAGPYRAWTPAAYTFPLPDGHRFPAYKYAGVRDRLSGLLPVLDTPNLSWADAARKLWAEGGAKRFTAGIAPCLMRAAPAHAAAFVAYEWTKNALA